MMRLIKQAVVCMAVSVATASLVQAQSKSTLGQFDDKLKKQRAPFKLAQRTANSQEKPETIGPGSVQSRDQGKPAPEPISKERRDELMAFVKANHPEIRPLINSLSKTRPGQYEAVMRALDREVKNLQALQKRSPGRYEKSLEQWVIKSKIRLLSAQLAIKKTPTEKTSIQQQLKRLIGKQHDLRTEQLAEDVAVTQKRLDRLASQWESLKSSRKSEIERQMTAISKTADRIIAAQQKAAEARKRQAKTDANAKQGNPGSTPNKKNPNDKNQAPNN